jgi:hypothetical protein
MKKKILGFHLVLFSAMVAWAEPPIITAVFQQDVHEVRRLLESGADPFEAKHDSTTAVDFAIWGRSKEIRNLVLNFQNRQGETPLIRAVFKQDTAMVQKLIENGANPFLYKKDGTNALDFASWGQSAAIKDLLLKHAYRYDQGDLLKCSFTFPAGQAQTFADKITRYYDYKTDDKKITNKQKMMEKYLSLWHQAYDADIAGSEIVAFDNIGLNEQEILNRSISADVLKGIAYSVHPSTYPYQQNHAYVDFANQRIGGGVMSWGFVQEEVELIESSFLPWTAQVRMEFDQNGHNSLNWCQKINLMNLDVEPKVLKFRLFAEVDQHTDITPDLLPGKHVHFKSIYGSNLFDIKADKVAKYLGRRHPVDIYAPALAAIAFNKGQKYEEWHIRQMLVAATKAFYLTMLAQNSESHPIIIHTGNWGTGAFNNSNKTAWSVQAIAFSAAARMFRDKNAAAKLTYEYDAFNKTGEDLVKAAEQELAGEMQGKKGLTANDAVKIIHGLTQKNDSWQVKK